ncbi:hypothetical protein [Terasakiella pusilla]|uniref:hypothetical protein n=1 Tax=Terasakiella pusilla TaxID=64973 RepID=UPI003AA8FE6D
MSNQPLAKGRVVYAAEFYPTNERDQNNKPKMKARYATLGRATMWPAEQPNEPFPISIDLDSLPIGSNGAMKLQIFWDQPEQQQYPQQAAHPNQPPQQPYGQPQSYGSFGNQPQR